MYRNYGGWCPLTGPNFHLSFDPGFGAFGHSLEGFGHTLGSFYSSFCLEAVNK